MDQRESFSEAVFIFEGGEIAAEMHFADFESKLKEACAFESHAASVIPAMYVVIGSSLAIRGIVCFNLAIDENGGSDPSFSVPLQHLAAVSGAGPDLGCGPIRLACRSQCSVSWHAHNLWEPEGEGDDHPLRLAQSLAWRNRLGYNNPSTGSSDLEFDALADGYDPLVDLLDESDTAVAPIEPSGSESSSESSGPSSSDSSNGSAQTPPTGTDNGANGTDSIRKLAQEQVQRKIERTFGSEGTVSLQKLILQHSEQLDSMTVKYRQDLEQQQQGYLDQIRGCRDEIQELKSMLRHEQTRNQRLQQLLRGEIR